MKREEGEYRPRTPRAGGEEGEGGGFTKQRSSLMSGKRRRKKACQFCKDKTATMIDYKAVDRLKRFLSDRGKIVPRRIAGTCAKHHRELTTVIRKARTMALLPYIGSGERERGDRYDRGDRDHRYDRGDRGDRGERSEHRGPRPAPAPSAERAS